MILFVNACVRKESRTKRLAEALLAKLDDEITEVKLEDIDFTITNEGFLAKRDALIMAGKFDDESFALARQFAEADTIVIAAPYWDLSFPATLKQYIENINVLGITFEYTPEGMPKGRCKAKKLYYVTTAGGTYVPDEFGYGYIKTLAKDFYGIVDVELIKATGFDVYGESPEAILEKACKEL